MSKDRIKNSKEKSDEALGRMFKVIADGELNGKENEAWETTVKFIEQNTDDSVLRTELRSFMNRYEDATDGHQKTKGEMQDKLFLDMMDHIKRNLSLMYYQGFHQGMNYYRGVVINTANELKEKMESEEKSS